VVERVSTSRDAVARVLLSKPRADEIDVFGVTHMGARRPANQDHFLICSLRKKMDVILTSLPGIDELPADTERLAFLAMVADGVGGTARGEEASRHAVRAVTQYLTHSMHCYYTADSADDDTFTQALQEAALRCHGELMAQTGADPAGRDMATTLTLWLGVWPRAYLLQVGDSRYYLLRNGALTQVSRDQTIAQDLLDKGVLTRAQASTTRWANVLSSAIGGPEARPVVTAIENGWDSVHLLCSDGLTRHVSDERIRERLMTMTGARQVCEDLVEDALAGGGTDNITVIVGRAVRRA
jgi:protein phosphatase